MKTVFCPAVSTQCPRAKCIAERNKGGFFCPRTIADKRAAVTRAEYERKEAEATRRVWRDMYGGKGLNK